MITGYKGQIRVNYQLAAEIVRWTANPTANGSEIDLVLGKVDKYWIRQGRLELVLVMNKTKWYWPKIQIRGIDNGKASIFAPGLPRNDVQ